MISLSVYTDDMKRIVWSRGSAFLAFSIGTFIVGFVAAVLVMYQLQNQPPAELAKPSPKQVDRHFPQVTFAAMGDMIPHDSIVQQAKTDTGYNFAPYFASIRPLYTKSDVVFCNVETPVAGDAVPISGYPSFNAPKEFARDLVGAAGCSMVNMANNHIFDKGQIGIDTSRQVWLDQKVVFTGANTTSEEQNAVSYFTKNGIKIAFVAFADFSNQTGHAPHSVNLYHDEALVTRLLTEARANADALIVSAHWGTEDSEVINENQIAAAQRFADLGADVVIGTGPHVLQPVRTVKGKNNNTTHVWFSIGNMLHSQIDKDELTGIIASFTLIKQPTGMIITDQRAQATFVSYEWSTTDRASENLAARKNIQLDTIKNADARIKKMFPDSSAKERLEYIKQTLGNENKVIVSP